MALPLSDLTTIIAAIVTTIAGLFAIGFSVREILRWLKKRRGTHDIPTQSEPGFHEFLTRDARVSRERNQKILVERGRSIAKQEGIQIEDILPADEAESLTDPTVSLPHETYLVDTICTALAREGKIVVILPSARSQYDVEGVGRTSVILPLLGLRIHASRLIGLDLEGFRSLREIPIERIPDRWCYLLATDIAFLGSSGRKLCVVPTQGEKMSFVWDLARHIFRMTEFGYRTGDHRKDPGRQKLLAIFDKIQFKPLDNIFGKLDKLYLVDEVVLLRRDISPTLHSPELSELEGDERLRELRDALLVSAKHGSPFWLKNQEKLNSYVNRILKTLDPDKIPPTSEIRFSGPDPEVPGHYFDQITDIIKTKENPITGEKPETMVQIKGIAFHNDLLTANLDHVDEIRLLVTSGEKIFNEKSFWECLSKVKKRITVKILLLDPSSVFTRNREEEAYADYPRGYLANEIRENIEVISRLGLDLKKTTNRVEISCAVYDEMPSFRLTFIGTETLLVTSYEKGKRTGKETEFYKITPQQMGMFFDGFNLEYKRVEAHSRTIFKS